MQSDEARLVARLGNRHDGINVAVYCSELQDPSEALAAALGEAGRQVPAPLDLELDAQITDGAPGRWVVRVRYLRACH